MSDDTKSDTIAYKIVSIDSTDRQIDFKIAINNSTDKDSLVEIARQLKIERNWKEKLVCTFYIKFPLNDNAWATCGYLPRCTECGTDKDHDGNPIQFMLLGMSESQAESLQKLHLDTIDNKTLLVSYLDDVSKCNTLLYTVNDNGMKVLMAQLFEDGRILQWLTFQEVNGQKRYYFDDDDDKNYVVINQALKSIEYFNSENKVFQSNAIN